MKKILLLTAFLVLVLAHVAFGLVDGNILIIVDENGHGTINGFLGLQTLPSALLADTGPGGLSSVLFYDTLNPPGLVGGDVLMFESPGILSDVIRFAPGQHLGGDTGGLFFYSDNVDGFDALADTVSPPGAFNTNLVSISEIGDEVNNGAIYTPLAGQPGFVIGAGAPVVYEFISDGAGPSVPEPASMLLLGSGLIGLAGYGRKKFFRK